MKLARTSALVLFACLASACSTLESVPGPEDRALVASATGTLLLAPSGDGIVNQVVTFVDLPSQRVHEVRVPGGWSALDGIDEHGRLAYITRPEADRSRGSARGTRLETLEVASGAVRTLLELGPEARGLRLAPRGERLVLWRTAGTDEVGVVALANGSVCWLTHDLGPVRDAHWLADGSAFVLVGLRGSARFTSATLELEERTTAALGPFTPDGSAQLVARADGFALVERDGRVRADPARFPWPLRRRGALIDASARPIGLCGPHHGLYAAMPTEGEGTDWSLSRGGVFLLQDGVLKVCDLVTGAFATVAPLPGEIVSVRYSPARLAALAGTH